MDKNVVSVQMFGDFQMKIGENLINEDMIRSPMVTKLLAYILINHNKVLSVQELGDALWSEEETDNQIGALKNLMYRLRNTLKKLEGESDYILTGQGSYYWNQKYTVEVDCEVFEKLCNQVKNTSEASLAKRQEEGEQAVQLYQREFLPKLSGEHWVIPVAAYYHSMYLSMVKNLAEIYKENRQYEEMERVCQRAVTLDSLDEYLHCLMIEALRGQHKEKLALRHYDMVVSLLYENLGVKPSKRLQEIYTSLLKEINEQEMDLRTIQKDLTEAIRPLGVFLCEYGVFRELYRLQSRQAERAGQSVFIVLFTLAQLSYLQKGSDVYLTVMKQGMTHLEQSLHSLRAGDVAARYSGAQYVVMLPACTYEMAKSVAERILARFYNDKKWNKYQLQYSLEAIAFPAEEE